LLDTDIPENSERWITGQLYGWFGEERLAQEIVLGVGGIRALRKLGIEIDIFHFNEGHALFAGFELVQEKKDNGLSHDEAVSKTKQEVVFTTHTPIVQGNESHPIDRMIYMGANLGMTEEQLETLGGNPFNMTVGALRLAKIANGVAQLHGDTSNKMWQHINNRAEIIAITNAIHLPTWVDDRIIPAAQNDGDIMFIHQENKQRLVEYIKEKNDV
jgi:starch phosphorylase